jgi:hypothetical protein
MLKLIYTVAILFFFKICAAQKKDTTVNTTAFFKGQITLTNNGVSLVPAFTLGRPAALFDLNMGKGRFSFDPMIRFALDGKPWAFIFWLHYKPIIKKKFTLNVGANPSVVFRDVAVITNTGATQNYLTAQRFFAFEVVPTFIINKNVSISVQSLNGYGLTPDVLQHNNFLAVRSSIILPIQNKFTLNLIPQFFYLKMDGRSGTFTNATINLYKNKFPISVNAVVSQALSGNILGNKFLWSVGAVYNINQNYTKK